MGRTNQRAWIHQYPPQALHQQLRDCTIIIDQKPSVRSLLFRHDNENCLPETMEIYPPLQGRRQKRVTTIVDYCNGLVCLRNCDEEIALWNPLIRKYKKLPSEPVQKHCTLITRSKDSDTPLHNILAFDSAKENFHVYKTPLQQIEYDNRKTCLGVLGGCLWYVVNAWKIYNEVWLMMEYGEESSWIQVYKIYLRANTIASNLNSDFEYLNVYLKPLKFSKDGMKVLLFDYKNLFWYDIEKKRINRLES